MRPKSHNGFRSLKGHVSHAEDSGTALVMQGPILLSNDFTFETLKLYRKIFPRTRLILSTWEDENAEELIKIRELGVEVILNNKPNYSGPANINFQIVSALKKSASIEPSTSSMRSAGPGYDAGAQAPGVLLTPRARR